MATAGPGLSSQAQALQQRIRTFTNPDLKEICRAASLQVSGTKAVLQKRIGDTLNDLVARNDGPGFARLSDKISKLRAPAASSSGRNLPPPTSSYGSPNVPSRFTQGLAVSGRNQFYSRIIFKESPFIAKQQLLASPLTLPTTQSGKGTQTLEIRLSNDVLAQMEADKDLKIFLFAAPDLPPIGGAYTNVSVDVAFPQHIEVRVNLDEVRHNYKGLKNKPGSTKPADITDKIRKKAEYKNTLQVTYAYTDKKWNFEVHLVRKYPVDELARRIEQRAVLSKEKVIRDMQRKADDPDIVATSSVMSLKDPVSTMRIDLPCRSTVCSHNGCFDAMSFLYLQEQAPTWTCPLCNKAVTYEALLIDQYFQDILKNTSKSTEQVTIEPDGRWSSGVTETPGSKANGKKSVRYDDSDDDLVEITDMSAPRSSVKNEHVEHSSNALFASSPPDSGTPSRGGTKRKSEVIDLTLSSDDEAPPPKKPLHNPSGTNGITDPFTNGGSRRSSANTYSTNNAHSRPVNGSSLNGMPYCYLSNATTARPLSPDPPSYRPPQPPSGSSSYTNHQYPSTWR